MEVVQSSPKRVERYEDRAQFKVKPQKLAKAKTPLRPARPVALHPSVIAFVGLVGCSLPAIADATLNEHVTPSNIEPLRRLACDNLGHPVKLNILVRWPSAQLDRETENYKRLVFWTADSNWGQTEYLFPSGSYRRTGDGYRIKGRFFPTWGGRHSATNSLAFMRFRSRSAPSAGLKFACP